MSTLNPPIDDGAAYVDHERPVLAMLSTRYRDLDPDGRRELYHEAWASVLVRRRSGAEIENLRGYLLGAADKLASKRVYGADARRRRTFDPAGQYFNSLPDSAELPEERVVAIDEARRVRMLVDELGTSERDLLKLRLDLGLEPAEIRERLGLTDRQYRRNAERAMKALLDQFRAFDTGEWARGKRSLLCACVMGIASQRQLDKAERLIQVDPCCRAMMAELRELGGHAAAILPVPVGMLAAGSGSTEVGRAAELFTGTSEHVTGLLGRSSEPRGVKARSWDALAGARRHALDTVATLKQHATQVSVRAADPTPLSGARPGAAAALLAGCVAAGSGAYCAVEGVPNRLQPALGIERAQTQASRPRKPVLASQGASTPRVSMPAPPPGPTVDPVAPSAPTSPSSADPVASAPAPTPVTPAPTPAPPETEFEPTAQAAAPAAPAATFRPVRQATPAPARSTSGEFAP
ncbi:MAG: hypothetical protein ACR2HC_09360 [Thermoleophilaceae bacterium]